MKKKTLKPKEVAAIAKATYFGNFHDNCGRVDRSGPTRLLARARGVKPLPPKSQRPVDCEGKHWCTTTGHHPGLERAMRDIAAWLGLDWSEYLSMTGTLRRLHVRERLAAVRAKARPKKKTARPRRKP